MSVSVPLRTVGSGRCGDGQVESDGLCRLGWFPLSQDSKVVVYILARRSVFMVAERTVFQAVFVSFVLVDETSFLTRFQAFGLFAL